VSIVGASAVVVGPSPVRAGSSVAVQPAVSPRTTTVEMSANVVEAGRSVG